MQKNKMIIPHAFALYNVIVWGTTFISTKVLLNSFHPVAILVYRFIIGYIALWLMKPKVLKFQGVKKEFWYFMAGLLGVTIYFLGENIALTMAPTGNVSIIVSMAPLFTAFAAWYFLKTKRPGLYFWIGFAVAMAGIVLINMEGTGFSPAHLKGDALALVAAIVWGLYGVVLRGGVKEEEDVIIRTRRIFFYGLLTMIPCVLFMDVNFSLDRIMEPVNLWNLMFLGVMATAAAYATWNYAVEKLGVMKSSVYIYGIPVVTIIAAALLIGEKITVSAIVGCILTTLGLMISEKKKV